MSATERASKILIQNMMQRNPLKLVSCETVEAAVDIMCANHISALPVVDDSDCLIGIVSLTDVMPVVSEKGSEQVVAVMTDAPVTVGLNESLRDCARLMMQHQVHHLPVVNKDKQLVGVVSSVDFIRLTADGMLRGVSEA